MTGGVVTEDEKRELLEAVTRASEETRVARARMLEASRARTEAVQAALDAGIPRQRIADAAGTHRNNLYRLVGRATR